MQLLCIGPKYESYQAKTELQQKEFSRIISETLTPFMGYFKGVSMIREDLTTYLYKDLLDTNVTWNAILPKALDAMIRDRMLPDTHDYFDTREYIWSPKITKECNMKFPLPKPSDFSNNAEYFKAVEKCINYRVKLGVKLLFEAHKAIFYIQDTLPIYSLRINDSDIGNGVLIIKLDVRRGIEQFSFGGMAMSREACLSLLEAGFGKGKLR